MLSMSFVTVPAFNRVDPVIISGPTIGVMKWSMYAFSSAVGGTQQRKIVFEPMLCASLSAPKTYGVLPLLAIPTITSSGVSAYSLIARAPLSGLSSSPSTDFRKAISPPAIIPCTNSGSVLKVGGHSEASNTPSLPLVPAPGRRRPTNAPRRCGRARSRRRRERARAAS